MRIATFNLESLDLPPRASVGLEERTRILKPQLQRADADILCLQEVNGQRIAGTHERSLLALDALLQGTQYEDYARISTSGLDGKGVADIHNLVILSRFPISCHKEISHDYVPPVPYSMTMAVPPPSAPEPITWDRPILCVTLILPNGKNLTVINSHLRAPLAAPVPGQKEAPFIWKTVGGWAEGYFIASIKRIGQALEIRLLLEALMDKDPEQLIAVCGDFNAGDHENALKIIAGAEEDTGNGRLAMRTLIPLERSAPQDQRFTVLHHGRPQMLDHILVNRPMLGYFRHLEIHNEALEDELIGYGKIGRPPDSYHAPVIAEFALD